MEKKKDNLIGLWTSARAFRDCLLEGSECNLLPFVKDGKLADFWDSSQLDEDPAKRWLWKDVFVDGIPDTEKDENVLCALMAKAVDNCQKCSGDSEHPQGEVLARLILPPTKEILFDSMFRDDIIWATYMLFDERAENGIGQYIHRNLINLKPDDINSNVLILLYRLPEFSGTFFSNYCLDLSDTMRNEIQPDYALVCDEDAYNDFNSDLTTLNIGRIIGKPVSNNTDLLRDGGVEDLVTRSQLLRDRFLVFMGNDSAQSLVSDLARINANKLSEEIKVLIYELDKSICGSDDDDKFIFYKSNDDVNESQRLEDELSSFILSVANELSKSVRNDEAKSKYKIHIINQLTKVRWKLANYLIWLAATHPDLSSYIVRHDFDFRRQNEGRRSLVRPSGIVIATRRNDNLKSFAARAEIIMHELLSPLTSFYAWDNLETSTKSLVLADYAKGAAHGFKNALMLPGFYLHGKADKLTKIVTSEDKNISTGSKNELNDILRDLEISKMLLEQLSQQAQLFFWVMAPDRFIEERNDSRQLQKWPESYCDIIITSTFLTSMAIVLSTIPPERFSGRGLTEESITKIAKDSVSSVLSLQSSNHNLTTFEELDQYISDIAVQLPKINVSFDVDSDLQMSIKLESVSRGALEGILTELFQNAIRVVLLEDFEANITFGISTENNIPYIFITNTSSKADAYKLRDAISAERIDSYSASGGIRGLRQITAFERELMTDLPFKIHRPQIQEDQFILDCTNIVWKIALSKYE